MNDLAHSDWVNSLSRCGLADLPDTGTRGVRLAEDEAELADALDDVTEILYGRTGLDLRRPYSEKLLGYTGEEAPARDEAVGDPQEGTAES